MIGLHLDKLTDLVKERYRVLLRRKDIDATVNHAPKSLPGHPLRHCSVHRSRGLDHRAIILLPVSAWPLSSLHAHDGRRSGLVDLDPGNYALAIHTGI